MQEGQDKQQAIGYLSGLAKHEREVFLKGLTQLATALPAAQDEVLRSRLLVLPREIEIHELRQKNQKRKAALEDLRQTQAKQQQAFEELAGSVSQLFQRIDNLSSNSTCSVSDSNSSSPAPGP